ncbi:MAG TPA: FprA family A-type flavoprotein, partial [bacterium]
MNPRKIKDNIFWVGAVDWDRRLFDSLMPLPTGTSYNAYLIQGSEKTALLDTVDPTMADLLLGQLSGVPSVDYVISHHAEQDHSGSIPLILQKYPQAKVIATSKAKDLLPDHLGIPADRLMIVADGDTLSLGDKTLKFVYTPWVHWPETMCTYLPEDRILFSCDFFGSHLATSALFSQDDDFVIEAVKSYYATIMMPFRLAIQKNLEKVKGLDIDLIAPSHGPIHAKPASIIGAYAAWVSESLRNAAVVAYASMHGSTKLMIQHLVSALVERGVEVHQFDMASASIEKMATSLVDAATIVLGAPVVNGGPHPQVAYAAYLANILKPKLKYGAVVGSYGWGGKM